MTSSDPGSEVPDSHFCQCLLVIEDIFTTPSKGPLKNHQPL
jgi:hypothetical protein